MTLPWVPKYSRRQRLGLFYAYIILLSVFFTVPLANAAALTVTANFTDAPTGTNIMQSGFHITHEWDTIYGSTTLQNWFEDTQFRIIRIQEFRDTNDPCITWNEATHTGTWDWTAVNQILDWCDENNAYVLICFLSFTSSGAGSLPGHDSATHMHNSGTTGMPSPTEYAYYVEDWAEHIVAVGHQDIVMFEIGNEAWQFYGSSSPDSTKLHNFINLYNAAQAVLETEIPSAYVGHDGGTLINVMDDFDDHSCNMTLIDFHKYDTGSTSSTDSYIFRRAEQYMVTTGSYYYSPDDARQAWIDYGGESNCIVINSECQLNYAWSPSDDRIQYISGAVWNSLVLRHEALTENVSYHIYFDEYATSSPSGFGYIDYSTPKLYYGYYPYKWLGNWLGVGDTFRNITSSSVNCRTMAWNDTGGNAYILLIHNSTSVDTVAVTATGFNASVLVSIDKIDNTYPWNNAIVQTDSQNSTSLSISFNGYGVAILQGELLGATGGGSPGGVGNYNFYGALSDANASHTSSIVVTAYDISGNFENFTVDAGLTETPTGFNMTNMDYFVWPVGSGAAYRRYEIEPDETTFYIFVPDATFSVYNFHILDYAGTFWTGTSYLRTIKVIGGAERTFEQVRTSANPLSYDIGVALVAGRNYIIELEDSTGTIYRYDFYASTTTTINLYVNPAVFSDQVKSAYKYVRGQATRSSDLSSITMLYQDDLGCTSVVYMTVHYQNWTIAYSTSVLTPGTEIVSVTWDSADNETDYRVRITSSHTTFGSMYWDYPLPAVASYLVPIDISFFGSQSWLPYVIPFGLVAITGGVFSTLSTPVGVFAMVGVAAMMKYLGWSNVEWNNIGLAMFVVFLFALTRKKKEEYV